MVIDTSALLAIFLPCLRHFTAHLEPVACAKLAGKPQVFTLCAH
jgi:hypothetical protein